MSNEQRVSDDIATVREYVSLNPNVTDEVTIHDALRSVDRIEATITEQAATIAKLTKENVAATGNAVGNYAKWLEEKACVDRLQAELDQLRAGRKQLVFTDKTNDWDARNTQRVCIRKPDGGYEWQDKAAIEAALRAAETKEPTNVYFLEITPPTAGAAQDQSAVTDAMVWRLSLRRWRRDQPGITWSGENRDHYETEAREDLEAALRAAETKEEQPAFKAGDRVRWWSPPLCEGTVLKNNGGFCKVQWDTGEVRRDEPNKLRASETKEPTR